MPKQDINGVVFNYELLGTNKTLPPIVFVAGYTCDINFWRPVAEDLAKQRQVLLFDNQGIGETKDDGLPLTVEKMATNTKALIDKLGLQKFVVVGFALGSFIAQRIAHDYPSDVLKIILLSSALKFSDRAKKLCDTLCSFRKDSKFDDYADLLYETAFGVGYKASTSKQVFRSNFVPLLKTSQTTEGQSRQVEALKAFDSTSWVKNIKVPVVIVSPAEDQFATPQESDLLARSIKSATNPMVKCITITNSGHSVLAEQLDKLKEIVIAECSSQLAPAHSQSKAHTSVEQEKNLHKQSPLSNTATEGFANQQPNNRLVMKSTPSLKCKL